jgi:type IV secretion system protein VirB4
MSEIVPYAHFLSEKPTEPGIIRLRGGGTLLGYDTSGPGHETSSDLEVSSACQRFGASLRQFGTGDFIHLVAHRIYATDYPDRPFPNRATYLVDRERAEAYRAAKYLRTISALYIANQDESAIINALKALFFASTEHQMRGTVQDQTHRFLHRCEQWEDAVGSTLGPRRKNNLELFRGLILAVNGTLYDAPMPRAGVPLNHILGQQDFIGGSTPKMGELHIRPVTLVHPWPKQTTEQVLATLLTHPGELMLSCRFVCLDQTDAESIARLERKHYIREANGTGVKQWFMNAFNLKQRPGANQDVEELIAEADDAISDIQKGVPYGWASITALVMGPDAAEVNSRARQLGKDLSANQHMGRIEDAMAVEAVKSSWPGQGTSNERRPLISGFNYADIGMPVGRWQGTPEIDSTFIPKGTAAPIIVTGSGLEPFYVPTSIRSVMHQIIIGPTTGGKSTLLGTMVAGLAVLPDVRIIWLDRDYSSFVLTHAMGGTYIELAANNSSPLCPFQWIEIENGTAWLFDWFSRLFKRWSIELNERQAADLTKALELAKVAGIRTMGAFIHLIHDPEMRGVLRNYVASGQWGHIFDAEPLPNVRTLLTTYEMRHLDALGERVSGPATELIIRDAEVGLGEKPTFVVVDEARWFLASAVGLPFIDRALRTFRKYNAGIILATQSLSEIENSDVRSLLLESTPIKIFLPNRAAQGEHVCQLYASLGLKEKEIELIAAQETIPQRDYLCTTEYGTRLFRLDLGAIGKALCASTGPNDVSKARAVLAKYGPERFLDAWLWVKQLGPEPSTVTRVITPTYVNGLVRSEATNAID